MSKIKEIMETTSITNDNMKNIKSICNKLVDNLDIRENQIFFIKELNELYVCAVNITKIIVY